MLQRRVGSIALVMAITLGIVFGANAGDRKRARFMAAPAPSGPVPGPLGETTTICPIFIAMNMGSYCVWYGIKCVDGHNVGPCPYSASCDISPQTPCSGCTPVGSKQGLGETVAVGFDGFAGPLQGPVEIPAKATAKFALPQDESANIELVRSIHKNIVARVKIPVANGLTEAVYVQLVSLTTSAQHPLDPRITVRRIGTVLFQGGHQIAPQDNVDVEIDAGDVKLMPGRTRVAVVNFQGDDYVVILKKP